MTFYFACVCHRFFDFWGIYFNISFIQFNFPWFHSPYQRQGNKHVNILKRTRLTNWKEKETSSMFFFSFRKFDLKSFNVVMWFLGGSFRRGWSQFPSAAGTTTSSSRRTPTWTVLSADTRSRTSSCSRVSPRTSWPIYGRHCVSLSHMTVSGREQLSNDCKIAHHHGRFCVCFKRATLKQNWNLLIWYVNIIKRKLAMRWSTSDAGDDDIS